MRQITVDEAKTYYDVHDSAHGFSHVMRVYRLSMQIARKEGAYINIVRSAALLHDVESCMTDVERRKQHHILSAVFADKVLVDHGWNQSDIEAVQHCIRAHRYRDENETPQTIEAKVLFDADKLDSIGAIGAARAIAVSVEKGLPFYQPPSEQFLETGKLVKGELHTAYHEYWFKLRHVRDRLLTETGKQLAGKRHQRMVEFFTQLASEYGLVEFEG